MAGAVIMLVVLVVAGPVALFAGGALWSALTGWVLADHADRAAGPPAPPDA